MSTLTTPAKTASEAALERFADQDPDKMPSDEVFLQSFRSRISPAPSEQIAGKLHYSALTIEEERAQEKTTFLERAKAAWRERREAEKLALRQRETQEQFQRDIESGRNRRELSQLLDTCRTIASQREQIELMLK